MKLINTPITILIADDDEEDQLLTQDALEESRLTNNLRFVNDGEELMDYLHHRGKYWNPQESPRPGLILLDLNMPKKSGHEALQEIKAHPQLRQIPVVVLTTFNTDIAIFRSYDLGANSFITKPVNFEGLVDIMKTLGKYWLTIVELPPDNFYE
jgi:CheY-like chemotaxis protein